MASPTATSIAGGHSADGSLPARTEAGAVPAASAQAPLLGEVKLDLPAKPDRTATELRNWLGKVAVLLAAQRQRRSADPRQLGRFRQSNEIERQLA